MRLGPYELARQIGAGGMGEVWIAHRQASGRAREAVAIKRLPRRLAGDPNYRRILLEEARLSQLLRHPNIVHTIEAGEADGEVFIAMELVDGLDLSRVTKLLALQGERLAIPVAAYVVAEILRGLSYAHNLEHHGELISLVHRDVSPHNVMLSASGTIKLADFGVARLSSEDTSGTHVKGKARYMPPEQLRGDSRSPTVDLFAVGAVLQELLDGVVFRDDAVDDARLLGMAIDGVVPAPKHPHEIPAELELLRRRLLATDPKQRPRSAQQALDLLLRWPAYRPRPEEVAALVKRLRQHEVELGSGATQTGLAHQATFLHTNDLELDGSDIAELADVVEAPDQILLELVSDASESASRIPANFPANYEDEHTNGTVGLDFELDHTDSHEDSGPAATGDHATPDSDPSLALDLSGHSFARHVPTSPNPSLPPRRAPWALALGTLLALGAGVSGAFVLGWLPTSEDPTPTPTSTLRQARVAGRGSLLDLGLRERGMDRLLVDDIRFDYRPDPAGDPLALLAAGEVEFAVVNHETFVRAGRPGTIVAVLGVPLTSEALVLDTADHPELRSLTELEGPLVFAAARDSGLARALGQTLGLATSITPLSDDAAVLAELERDDSTIVAGIIHAPWIARARAAGMTIAVTAHDRPGVDAELLVVRDAVLEADPELVEGVVATYYAGVLGLQQDPVQLAERAAVAQGIERAEAEDALAGLCIFDGPGAVAWLEQLGADAAIEPRFVRALAQPDAAPGNDLQRCLARSKPSSKASQPLGAVAWPKSDVVVFERGAARLSATGSEQIGELASELADFNPATVSAKVVGFGERRGSAGRKLGRARAQHLVERLRAAGVLLELSATGHDRRDAPPSQVRVLLSRAP